MENVIAIGAGLVWRAFIDILTDSDYRLTGTLVGLWEGFVLSHFLQKNPRSPNDAYLALATRFAIDFMLTNSLVRFALTGVWTVVGLLLADLAPSVLRETGLRHVYRALRRDTRAMRRAMPRWRIKNDIQVPNISISNPVPGLFSRPPASTVASSTRAVPPASPAPILQRRSRSGQVTPSETNTLTREVLPGPSPALIHIDVDPGFPPFDPNPHSHRSSYLSNSSDSDPSRHDPIPIPDDDRVHNTVPSHMQEQEQEQGPELSVLELTPPVATIGTTSSNVEIISPTPRARIGALPFIPDSEINLNAHTPSVPPSESRSRVGSLFSTIGAGIFSQNARAHVGEVGSDQGSDLGKVHAPFRQRASSAGVSGQALNQPTSGNQSNVTGQQHSSKWEHSMLRHPEEPIVFDGAAGTENFISGFAIQAGRQMPPRSGTPQAQPGSGGVRASSALGLSTPLSPSEMAATPPNPTPASAPQTKPPTPTPAPQTRQTVPASRSRSGTPGPTSNIPTLTLPSKTTTPVPPSKTPTPVPPSKTTTPVPPSKTTTPVPPSKTPTPIPPSRTSTPIPPSKTSTSKRKSSPDPTSTSILNPTDYDPSDPVPPMPGLKSPSTEHDPIIPDAVVRGASATRNFNPLDTTTADVDDDPPPPFKEFESPVHLRGPYFGAGVIGGRGPGGERVVQGSGSGAAAEPAAAKGGAEGDGQKGVTTEEADDVGGGDAGEGTNKTIETSQDSGDHARGANTTKQGESAQEKVKDNQEQENSKQDEDGAVNDSQVTCEDAKLASGDNGDTQVAGSAPKLQPTCLTPEQKEAETHRNAFLLKEVARLEESREKLNSSDEQGLSEIQARLSVMKERISRTNFADLPEHSPPTPKIITVNRNVPDICSELADVIVDLLIERRDAGPIEVTVIASKNKQKTMDKPFKEFIVEKNKFGIHSDPVAGQYVITV